MSLFSTLGRVHQIAVLTECKVLGTTGTYLAEGVALINGVTVKLRPATESGDRVVSQSIGTEEYRRWFVIPKQPLSGTQIFPPSPSGIQIGASLIFNGETYIVDKILDIGGRGTVFNLECLRTVASDAGLAR